MANSIIPLLVLGVLIVGFLLVASFWRKSVIREKSLKRLQTPFPWKTRDIVNEEGVTIMARPDAPVTESIFKRYKALPWLIGVAAGFLMYWPLGCKLPTHALPKDADFLYRAFVAVWEFVYCITIGVIVQLLVAQVEDYIFERKKARLDKQLADSLDLMITSLRAGVSVEGAMERAAGEIKQPLKAELENIINRIRFGDDRRQVMRRFMIRIPMESYRLFAVTMAVHFEVGGALAPTLAVVARIVRDRMEIAQRVRSLTAQSRVSTFLLIIITYGIALLMYLHDPPGVRKFCASDIGAGVIAGSMALEAVGIVWQAAKSKINV